MSIHERIRRFGGLISVYKRREDALARRMRDAQALAQREQEQLANIEAIKTDYEKGLLDAGREGASAQRMKNWQRFVRSLDAVHAEQLDRTRRAAGVSDEHRDAWLAQYRRVKGFETLAQRLETDRDADQARSERRQLDEIGARAHSNARAHSAKARDDGK
jgi:flagellar export protein FliJ